MDNRVQKTRPPEELTMRTDDLPPLPEPWILDTTAAPGSRHHFALDQMHEYARAHAAALQAENDKLHAQAAETLGIWVFSYSEMVQISGELDDIIDAARAAITGDSQS